MTTADVTLLVPVFANSEKELELFFEQYARYSQSEQVFFIYERDTCNFDFEARVKSWAIKNEIACVVRTVEGRLGIGFALNKAMQEIKSEYVSRHDLGDDMLPNKFQAIQTAIRCYPDVDIFYSQAILATNGEKRLSKYAVTTAQMKRALIISNPLCHPTVTLKRSSILLIGNYDANLRFCEDLDLWMRALNCNLKFQCINEPTIVYYCPNETRKNSNWTANLQVRMKNFGASNILYSVMGITIMLLYNTFPYRLRKIVYGFLK